MHTQRKVHTFAIVCLVTSKHVRLVREVHSGHDICTPLLLQLMHDHFLLGQIFGELLSKYAQKLK
jgi:hypothetical protein